MSLSAHGFDMVLTSSPFAHALISLQIALIGSDILSGFDFKTQKEV